MTEREVVDARTPAQWVQRLIEAGQMREAGLREVDAAKKDGRWP